MPKTHEQKYNEAADRNMANSLTHWVKELVKHGEGKFSAENIAHILGVRQSDTTRMTIIREAVAKATK